jgi:hypothetical protein
LSVEFLESNNGYLEIRDIEFGHLDHAVMMIEFGKGAGNALHVRITSDAPDTFDPNNPLDAYSLLSDTLRSIAEFVDEAVAANVGLASKPFEAHEPDEPTQASPFPKVN